MLIEYPQTPIPTFSIATDRPMKGRLPLSALCNNISQRTHPLPESSRVTSPSQSSTSQETSSPSVSLLRHAFQSPTPSLNTPSSDPQTLEQHLPSIDQLYILSCHKNSRSHLASSRLPFSPRPSLHTPFDPVTSNAAPTSPRYIPHPRHLPSSSICHDFPSNTTNSKLPDCPAKQRNGGRVHPIANVDDYLPRPCRKIQTTSFPAGAHASKSVDLYPKRRYSLQTASRTCTNCNISQTRQWVRGENQSWLCHSCGQFWRKNGYARPRALWNRPTFKRSSRKTRVRGQSDVSARSKASPRQTVSSSFLDGKKMIQWEIRLPPIQACSNFRDSLGTRNGLKASHIGSSLKSRSDENKDKSQRD